MSAAPDPRAIHTSGALAAENVHLVRGGRYVLETVDLVAHPGRLLVLVGPNGAGKSSLLSVLAGLLAPSRGCATLDGRSLDAWPPRTLARRRAMLSQNVRMDFGFSAREVVLLGRSPHHGLSRQDDDERITEAALRNAHAWDLRDRKYLQLSGGEQRRVQLARVLAQLENAGGEPGWLLLDEPEAGLDIAHQHFVLRLARRWARRGCGVIAVLHDLNLAARYADDVALLAHGRLLRCGPPAYTLDPEVLSAVYGIRMRRAACGNAMADYVMVAP